MTWNKIVLGGVFELRRVTSRSQENDALNQQEWSHFITLLILSGNSLTYVFWEQLVVSTTGNMTWLEVVESILQSWFYILQCDPSTLDNKAIFEIWSKHIGKHSNFWNMIIAYWIRWQFFKYDWITEQFLKRKNETLLECVADSSGEKSPLSIVDTIDFLKQQRPQFSCQEMIQSSRSAKFRYSISPIAFETGFLGWKPRSQNILSK